MGLTCCKLSNHDLLFFFVTLAHLHYLTTFDSERVRLFTKQQYWRWIENDCAVVHLVKAKGSNIGNLATDKNIIGGFQEHR